MGRLMCLLDLGWAEFDAAYAQSKFANLLFAKELAKRFAKEQIHAFSLHPGSELLTLSPEKSRAAS